MNVPSRVYFPTVFGLISGFLTLLLATGTCLWALIFFVPQALEASSGQLIRLPRIIWVFVYFLDWIYGLPGAWPLLGITGVSIALGSITAFIVYAWVERICTPTRVTPQHAIIENAVYHSHSPVVAPSPPPIIDQSSPFASERIEFARRLYSEIESYYNTVPYGVFADQASWHAFLANHHLFAHFFAVCQLERREPIDPNDGSWVTGSTVQKYLNDHEPW